MTPRAISTRDAGLALISRLNRWMLAGAVTLTGAVSLLAARSFHGRSASASVSRSAGSSSGSSSSSAGSGGSLQQPAQAPSSSVSPAPAPVVSGGS